MGTVNVTLNYMQGASGGGHLLPVYDPNPTIDEALTSSGTATSTTGAAPTLAAMGGRSATNMVWRVVTDTAIWAAFGTSPTAAAGTSHYVPANGHIDVFAMPGHKVSVIDA